MAKRKRSRKRSGPSLATRVGERLGAVSWGRLMRRGLGLMVLAGLVCGAAYGLPELEAYVNAQPEFHRPLRIELVDPPAWLEANEHIAQRVIARCGVYEDDHRLDPKLARRAATSLALIGWIKQVHEVSIGADDVVRVCCDYREPIAWVSYGDHYYLVDGEGVRLPGRYSHGEVSRDSGLLLVMGVRTPPPDEGRTWKGEDLAAGIQLVTLLRDKPYYDQLTAVFVTNYDGRVDPRSSHIELATDRGARIRWGRAPGREIDEPTVEQKLAHLQGIWQEHDRIDMGRAWVDIQVWPDRVIVPVANWQEGGHQQS